MIPALLLLLLRVQLGWRTAVIYTSICLDQVQQRCVKTSTNLHAHGSSRIGARCECAIQANTTIDHFSIFCFVASAHYRKK
jgi:hypothetical protein